MLLLITFWRYIYELWQTDPDPTPDPATRLWPSRRQQKWMFLLITFCRYIYELWLTDPDPTPDIAIFVNDLQEGNKNYFFFFFAYYFLKTHLHHF